MKHVRFSLFNALLNFQNIKEQSDLRRVYCAMRKRLIEVLRCACMVAQLARGLWNDFAHLHNVSVALLADKRSKTALDTSHNICV